MKILEHIENIFSPSGKLPEGFVRNPDFYAMYLVESFGYVPEVIHASDGATYVYFDNVNPLLMSLLRRMGFRPHLHKSHKYTPHKFIYRSLVNKNTPRETLSVVNSLIKMSTDGYKVDTISPEYIRYVANYNLKTR